jgi:AcrR family transcriptional regulator
MIIAATALLDSGGEGAVTLRTVGHASGISHNAPYKHFKSRIRDRQSQHEIHFEVPQ